MRIAIACVVLALLLGVPDAVSFGTIDAMGAAIQDEDDGYLLPKKVKAKLRTDRPEKSKLTAEGVLDMGSEHETNLAGPGTLIVGGLEIAVPGLSRSGRTYRYSDGGVTFKIKAPGDDSSRGKFKLKIKRELTGLVDPDGALEISYATGDLEAATVVDLAAGKYRAGRNRGSLLEPLLWVEEAVIEQHTVRRDRFDVVLGLATDGTTPAQIEDVRIACENFETTIPGTSFTRNGDRWEWTGDSGGITEVVVDYGRERVSISGGEIYGLGSYSEGPNPRSFSFDVGADGRAAVVTLKGNRLRLRY